MQLPGRLAVAALISGEPGHTLRVYGVALGDSAANIGGNDGSERDVSFAADGGTVSRIYLSEKCFTGIHWHTPEDVVASLGPPDLIERGDRNSRLTFPNLSLVVFLNHQTREATATIMDVARVGPRRYSVRDLLNGDRSAMPGCSVSAPVPGPRGQA